MTKTAKKTVAKGAPKPTIVVKAPATKTAATKTAATKTAATKAAGGMTSLAPSILAVAEALDVETAPVDGEEHTEAIAVDWLSDMLDDVEPLAGDEPHETPDDNEPAEHEVPAQARRIWQWLTKPVVPLCLAGALIAVSVLLWFSRASVSDASALTSARTSALAAAKTDSVELASYSYQHLDQDFGKVLADSTPSFKQSFSQSSDALKTILTRYNATAKANVVAAGIVSASTGRAVALVFLNQTVTNTTQKAGQPTTTQSRVEITLLHEHGRWLIDQVSLL